MSRTEPSKEELKTLRRHAKQDDPASLCLMGDFHMSGQGGMRQDEKRALRYYRRAADGGLAEGSYKAARVLVGLTEHDTTVPPLERYTEAAQYAYKSVLQGDGNGVILLDNIRKAMMGDTLSVCFKSCVATMGADDTAALAQEIGTLLTNMGMRVAQPSVSASAARAAPDV